jgi:hypothetical protein
MSREKFQSLLEVESNTKQYFDQLVNTIVWECNLMFGNHVPLCSVVRGLTNLMALSSLEHIMSMTFIKRLKLW